MPGPKMGPRPPDFDEAVIRQSPTMVRWAGMAEGERLRYACREFIKGHNDDEERLMRRIMIARRNNIRDHEVLKKARRNSRANASTSSTTTTRQPPAAAAATKGKPITRQRQPATTISDSQVEKEMDVAAVEKTRSYKAWIELEKGAEFVYNQKYIKGKEGHDWLLRKNIWRRMRYRRENKKLVEKLKTVEGGGTEAAAYVNDSSVTKEEATAAADSPGDAATTAAAAASSELHLADQDAVEAAVAAAESFGKTTMDDDDVVKKAEPTMEAVANPLEAVAAQAALDAAAQIAAATAGAETTADEVPKEDAVEV